MERLFYTFNNINFNIIQYNTYYVIEDIVVQQYPNKTYISLRLLDIGTLHNDINDGLEDLLLQRVKNIKFDLSWSYNDVLQNIFKGIGPYHCENCMYYGSNKEGIKTKLCENCFIHS